MNKNQLTSYHLFCFVYIGFADLSNQKITKNVIEEIERKVAQWMRVNPTNIVEFNRILEETYTWYNSLSDVDQLTTVLEVAKAINQIEELTLENKKTFLSDIRDIAVVDGRFNETEKHMHDIIARELGINVMTTDKDIKKKIGF
jgi:tellurite resistance protein